MYVIHFTLPSVSNKLTLQEEVKSVILHLPFVVLRLSGKTKDKVLSHPVLNLNVNDSGFTIGPSRFAVSSTIV